VTLGDNEGMAVTRQASEVSAAAPGPAGLAPLRAALRAPFTARARRELLFCLAGAPFVLVNPLTAFFLIVILVRVVTPHRPPNPSPPDIVISFAAVALLVAILVAARWLGPLERRLAARLLGAPADAPPPGGRAGLRDGAGWRAMAYLLVRLPVAVLELYAAFFWLAGLVNLSYPFWWQAFRNHPPGVRLSPVPVFTPFGWFGQGTFRVSTLPGTFAAFAAGAAMLLAAPWVTRAVAAADGWLIRSLLGPDRLAQRVQDLERSRALAVDDSAALLRRLERDLHDGAQIRLATLAMNLGMAKQKLGDAGEVPDAAAARELVDAAWQGAKDALGELRNLARGIHPPALDTGLADALATLAAGSPIPAEVSAAVPVRPTPAIETIAYFCAAELLANAVKHSRANQVKIQAAGSGERLRVTVGDDGAGGADPARGSGLAGLAHRVAMVDGRLSIASPPGGPTQVTVELPLRA